LTQQSGKESLEQNIEKTRTLLAEAQRNPSDKQAYSLLLWKVAAEAEYVAFRISTMSGLKDYEPTDPAESDGGSDPLQTAQSLLNEVQQSYQKNPKQAYERIRRVVTVIRKVYGTEEKTRTKASKPETIDT
jgi:hypothetical protein